MTNYIAFSIPLSHVGEERLTWKMSVRRQDIKKKDDNQENDDDDDENVKNEEKLTEPALSYHKYICLSWNKVELQSQVRLIDTYYMSQITRLWLAQIKILKIFENVITLQQQHPSSCLLIFIRVAARNLPSPRHTPNLLHTLPVYLVSCTEKNPFIYFIFSV